MYEYKVIENYISKEEAYSFAEWAIQNQTKHPVFEKYYGSGKIPPHIDTEGKIDNLLSMASEWFIDTYKVKNLVFDRTHGNIMYPGAILPAHKDKLDEYDLGRGPGNAYVCLLFLTDDYSGGNLLFPEQNASFKPSAGDAIFFPGCLIAHGVSEVIDGIRVNLVNHFFGDLPESDTI